MLHSRRRLIWLPVLALALLMFAGSDTQAHVTLELPNGGESLEVGSVYTIRWRVVVQHSLQNWDLAYSNSGAGGPWIPIVTDLFPGDPTPGSIHTFDWTVPDDATADARVRVIQDNTVGDYTDISNSSFEIFAEPTTIMTTTEVATGLSSPIFLTSPPSDYDRQFVIEQVGRIRIIKSGALLVSPFLDISSRVVSGGERGLLGLAFHPDYANNGNFYVYYTASIPSGQTTVSRFTVSGNADLAEASSEEIILTQTQPFENHNGGMIAFGPNDGYLYIGLGDGGSGGDPNNYAQNGMSLLGKMLRIDVDDSPTYSVPLSNPFTGDGSVLDEIWALGLRNPWRWSFDRSNGDLWIADVGQGDWEEVDRQLGSSSGGENYGWSLKQGDHCYHPASNCDPSGILDDPIYEYDHAAGPWGSRCSITGGFVYRGCAMPELHGTYFFADYCTGEIWSFQHNGAGLVNFADRTGELTGGSPFQVSSFGEDARGELYLMDHFNGRVLKIVPSGAPSACEVLTCCSGRVGDANGQGGDEPTIGDVSVLIDAKFITGTCDGVLSCLLEADVNQSGGIDADCGAVTIGDVSVLIDYLFITGSSLGLADCL